VLFKDYFGVGAGANGFVVVAHQECK